MQTLKTLKRWGLILLILLVTAGLETGCSSQSGSGDAHAARGVRAFQAKDYALAARELEQATAQGVSAYDMEEIFTILGRTYEQLDQFEEAIAAHRQALAVNPNYYQAWVNLGIVYRLSGDFDQAEQSYQQALKLAPTYPELYASLGALYVFKNEPDKAIVSLEKAIGLDPQLAVSHANLALAYAMVNRFDEAEARLKQATALGYTQSIIIQSRINALKALQP